jgi:hypothetical protein
VAHRAIFGQSASAQAALVPRGRLKVAALDAQHAAARARGDTSPGRFELVGREALHREVNVVLHTHQQFHLIELRYAQGSENIPRKIPTVRRESGGGPGQYRFHRIGGGLHRNRVGRGLADHERVGDVPRAGG